MDVKKVVNELSGPLTKVGAPEADNDSINPPDFFRKSVFLLKFLIEIHYLFIANCIFKLSLLFQCTDNCKTYKKICMGNFDPLRRSRKFELSAVLVLR